MGYEWKSDVQHLGSIIIRVDSIFPLFFPSCWVKQTVIFGVLAAILDHEATLVMEGTVNGAKQERRGQRMWRPIPILKNLPLDFNKNQK